MRAQVRSREGATPLRERAARGVQGGATGGWAQWHGRDLEGVGSAGWVRRRG